MPPLFRPMFSLAAVLAAATPLSALTLPSGTRHAAPPTRRAHLVASADKPVTAAVIGGGLGGLAVAIALRRVGIVAPETLLEAHLWSIRAWVQTPEADDGPRRAYIARPTNK